MAQYSESHSSDGANPSLVASDSISNSSTTGISGNTSGSFVRLGGEWEFAKDVKIKPDLILHQWSYGDSSHFSASTYETTYALAMSKDFGKYVGLHLYLAGINYNWSGSYAGSSQWKQTLDQLMGGEFEFIF